jgi:hypothetical protein
MLALCRARWMDFCTAESKVKCHSKKRSFFFLTQVEFHSIQYCVDIQLKSGVAAQRLMKLLQYL